MLRKVLGALGTTAAVLAAGQASAGALGSPNEIFIGGATAVQETFQLDLLVRFCNYDGNANDADGVITPQVFVDSYSVLPGGGNGSAATPTLRHGSHGVVHCNAKTSLAGSFLPGAEIAIYKYNGGSGTGVAPVADPVTAPAADQKYMDASTSACTQVVPTSNPGPGNTFVTVDGVTRFKFYTCPSSTIVTQAPDGGISDVEPKMFVGQLATGYGASVPGISPDKPQNDFVDQGNLIVKSGPGVVFGVAVTLPFYDELVDDQKAAGLLPDCPASPTRAERDSLKCMPSLPTPLIQSVFTGEISNWTTRTIYGQTLSPPAFFAGPYSPTYTRGADGAKVNICRRTAGSGTNAQFAAEFLRTNCVNNSPAMKTAANNVPQAVASPQVYENEGSGNLDSCMNALATGNGYNGGFTNGITNFPATPTPTNGGNSSVVPQGRTAYAIAYNSLERNAALTNNYRFVKVDFVAPTLENAYNGAYKDVYYTSYQNRVTGTDTPDPRLGAIRTVAADATELGVLKEFFAIWETPTPSSVDAVNRGLIVNPDGIANNGDEWQGGLVVPSKTAPAVFAGGPTGTDPRVPWARETASGTADSCQNLSYKN